MKNVMSVPRFIRTRFMCNFLEEKHRLKLSLSVKRNFQPPLRAAQERRRGPAYFVVEELICKAHFNDIKNLPMKETFMQIRFNT